ncbi:hypothetical protein C8R45DRAFT_1047461 [Mycena sanguinolenta]|nr:hypothetical protein C8R45DRAFT_1047461 [Mycena sanguinolenta]
MAKFCCCGTLIMPLSEAIVSGSSSLCIPRSCPDSSAFFPFLPEVPIMTSCGPIWASCLRKTFETLGWSVLEYQRLDLPARRAMTSYYLPVSNSAALFLL